MIVHYIVASYIVWCWPIFPTEVFTGYKDNCSVEHAELQLEISQRLNYLE